MTPNSYDVCGRYAIDRWGVWWYVGGRTRRHWFLGWLWWVERVPVEGIIGGRTPIGDAYIPARGWAWSETEAKNRAVEQALIRADRLGEHYPSPD